LLVEEPAVAEIGSTATDKNARRTTTALATSIAKSRVKKHGFDIGVVGIEQRRQKELMRKCVCHPLNAFKTITERFGAAYAPQNGGKRHPMVY
jgi:hypothetical protein